MVEQNTGITLPFDARILVAKPRAGIGDFILFMPALRALRYTYPNACIDLLVSPNLGKLIGIQSIKNLNLFDHIICSPEKIPSKVSEEPSQSLPLRSEFAEFMSLLHDLRSAHYDAVLLFQHLEEASRIKMIRCIISATRAKWKVGLDNGLGAFLNVKIYDKGYGVMHQAEYPMAVVEAVGAKVHNKSLFFPLDEEDCRQARQLLWKEKEPSIQRPVIAMHPGCASYMEARRWSLERFAQLADILYREFGGELVLLGGSEERSIREQVVHSMQSAMPTLILSGHESIGLTASIIKQCDLFIGNDSGLMHVSTAVGTPTVGIFGPTNHKAWGPYTRTNTKQSMVVRLDLPCMPCAYVGHSSGTTQGCSTRDCLNQLSVDLVAKAARTLLYDTYSKNY